MATLAENWTMGIVVCEKCGHEWNAACEDGALPRVAQAVAEVVTGKKAFQCPCPVCGEMSRMVEIIGE